MLVVQFFCNNPLKTIRELSKSAVKVYDWYAGSATFLFYPFGPANKGGRGDFRPKILEVVEKTGRPLPEVAEEVCSHYDSSSVRY